MNRFRAPVCCQPRRVYKSQDKQSELAAINNLLSSQVISSESLTSFGHRHPLIVSQLQLLSDQQQQQQQQRQQTCEQPNLEYR